MNDGTATAKKKSEKKRTCSPLVDQNERLLTVLSSIERQIKLQTSLRSAFVRGLVYGLGTIIGATLLIALLGGVLATAVDSLQSIPFIGQYFSEQQLTNYLNETQ